MAGFGQTMREESDLNLRQHILDYLIALMDDANDFSWTSAKASNAVLLCQMEQGEVKDFLISLPLAGSGEQMLKNMYQIHSRLLQECQMQTKNLQKLQNQCLAHISAKVLACKLNPMRQVGGVYIYILQIMVGHFHMRKWITKVKIHSLQKTISVG